MVRCECGSHEGRAGGGESTWSGGGGAVHESPLLLLSKPLNLSPQDLGQGRIFPDPHLCLAVIPQLPYLRKCSSPWSFSK